MAKEQTKTQKVIAFATKWLARVGAGVLMFAGGMKFLGGVDVIIAYPFVGVTVVLLIKYMFDEA